MIHFFQKKLSLLALALCLSSALYAQKFKLSVGPEVAIPTGNSSNISSVGVGGYLKLEQAITQKIAVTETAELTTFFGKKFLGERSQNLNYLPIKLGLKYYPSESFYGEGQAGLAFPINNGNKSNFTWAIGAGSFVKSNNNGAQFDFGLRYQAISNIVRNSFQSDKGTNFSYFALRVGYTLGF